MAGFKTKVTPEIENLTEVCKEHTSLDLSLYAKYDVKRGLRDINGKGVLAGLTQVSNVKATKIVDGKEVPCAGSLSYRGYDIKDLTRGFIEDDRYGFEEVTYLLLFGSLPDKKQLADFTREFSMKKNNMPLNLRERINSRISLLCSVIVLVLLVLVMHQMDYTLIRKPQKEAAEAATLKEQQDKIKAETPVISTASVIAVGDNLYHSKLYESGENDSGIWNYAHIYTHVLDQIQAADVAMIDQETVFAPSHAAVSTYPSFATPQEVGDAIIKAVFYVVESATNHADDYGYDYLKSTLDFWSTNYP